MILAHSPPHAWQESPVGPLPMSQAGCTQALKPDPVVAPSEVQVTALFSAPNAFDGAVVPLYSVPPIVSLSQQLSVLKCSKTKVPLMCPRRKVQASLLPYSEPAKLLEKQFPATAHLPDAPAFKNIPTTGTVHWESELEPVDDVE